MYKELEFMSTNETENGITLTFQTDKNRRNNPWFTFIRFWYKKTQFGYAWHNVLELNRQMKVS